MWTNRRVSILCGHMGWCPCCAEPLEGVHIVWTHRRVSILCGHIGGCPYYVDT